MSEVQDRPATAPRTGPTSAPTTADVATDLVAMWKAGQFDQAGEKYWADDVVSFENMPGAEMAEIRGKAGVRGKGEWWNANHEIHGVVVEGPYLHGDQFAVRFKMDVTPKGGERRTMDEVGLYTIRDGKISEEKFYD